MSTVGMQVEMIMGAPYLTDGSNPLILEPKMNWTQTMMTCASATRASIKTLKSGVQMMRRELKHRGEIQHGINRHPRDNGCDGEGIGLQSRKFHFKI